MSSLTATASWYRLQPSRGWAAFNLKELWQYRELAYFLAWRDVKVRYKQTLIGVLWVLLQPLAMTSAFWLVFGRFTSVPSESIPYPLYVLVALIPWQFFSRVISESTNSLITDQRLITRVYFPRLAVPIATALAASIDFGLAMGLVALLMVWFGFVPGVALVLIPVATLLMVAAALGVGAWLAALNVEYRDVMHAIPFLVHFWFFVTPVLYATSSVPDSWQWILSLNPMTIVIETFRWSLLSTPPTNFYVSAISATIDVVPPTGTLVCRLTGRRSLNRYG
jgi:lipopolysaccharide transport system permease protein